ncbi:MAG: nickel ABC transporter substrate-binding protein [Desulfocurvibacter africanus]
MRSRRIVAFVFTLVMLLLGQQAISHAASKDTLVFSWTSNVGPLNPHLYSPSQMFAQDMVYEPLVRYGDDGTILPCLAERWSISPDGRTYTFFLRKGVVFSDGAPFDANVVKKNFDAVLANAERHTWLELINQIADTAAPDAYTFTLMLKHAYYPTLQELCLIRPLRFLSPAAFPESGNTAEGIKKPVGTGPWILVETRKGEHDIFERNERYWERKPAMKRIVVKVIPDPDTRAVALQTGEIDLIYGVGQISLESFARLRKQGRFGTVISQPLATRAMAINSGRGATADLAVRKAILHSVNRAAIIKNIFMDIELPAETFFSPDTPYCNLGLAPYAHDVALAGKILDEAGWKRVPGNDFRSKDGKALSLDLCFVGNDALQKSLAEAIQGDLRKAGIRAVLIGEEPDSFYNRQRSGQFGMIFGDTFGAPYDPHSMVSSMRAPSHADYQAQVGLPMKSDLDKQINQVLLTVDGNKRQAIYRDILTTLHEQAVYLPLSYMTGAIVHDPDLTEVNYGPTKNEIPFTDMRWR